MGNKVRILMKAQQETKAIYMALDLNMERAKIVKSSSAMRSNMYAKERIPKTKAQKEAKEIKEIKSRMAILKSQGYGK
jgi:hypothetical protein